MTEQSQGALDLALLWHMHQPSYRDPISGEIALPWVRLHSTRAYFDMAWLLDRHPSIRVTFNFVPILLEQMQAYVENDERDRYWDLSRKSARLLTAAERSVIVRHFFAAHVDTCIRPRARYWQLYQRRNALQNDKFENAFSDEELRDIQVLFNLAWFGYAARVEFPLIEELERKGRDFTEDEKLKLLDLQIAVMRRVLPLYRKLLDRGQIELTTTPYYHPILPLIIDSEVAERCQPGRPRPPQFAWYDDAEVHVRRAITAHKAAFGVAPQGMWPAEGSVSPEVVELMARQGVKWIASDEAQLWNSVGERNRRELFKPYRVSHNGQSLSMIFRDRGLSDALSFTYSRNSADLSVNDFMKVAEAIRDRIPAGERGLLVVALDGENPWEYYQDSGRPFLEKLYETFEKTNIVRTVRVGDHIAECPPKNTIENLHTGSWINSDFGIWIGGSIENCAWKLLGETRKFFADLPQDSVDADSMSAAYEHLLQAEGSDWFWWYGEPFHSENDEEFDYLFRAHLRQVYVLCGVEPPSILDRSLYPPKAPACSRLPSFFVTPRFGQGERSTYYDWLGGGLYELVSACSSMYHAAKYFGTLYYGFDLSHAYLRLETMPGEPLPEWNKLTLRIRLYAQDREFCAQIPMGNLGAAKFCQIVNDVEKPIDLKIDRIKLIDGEFEVALPFDVMGVKPGEQLRISLHLLRRNVEVERLPQGEDIQITVPEADFEAIRWWP